MTDHDLAQRICGALLISFGAVDVEKVEQVLADSRPRPAFSQVREVWKNVSLSRLERVKAYRAEFPGSDLLEAVKAVDHEAELQRIIAELNGESDA